MTLTAPRRRPGGGMPDMLWRGLSFFLAIIIITQFYLLLYQDRSVADVLGGTDSPVSWAYVPARDANNIGLTQNQCNQAFPNLYYEVDRAVSFWRKRGHTITPDDTDIGWRTTGAIRILIHDNQVRILQTIKAWFPDAYRDRSFGTLLNLHRALLGAQASGERLPNIEFSITLDDKSLIPSGRSNHKTIWAFTRNVHDVPQEKLWLMPDNQFWASPPFAGSFFEMQGRAHAHDALLTQKIPKAVWRGRTATNQELRGALIDATKGKDWADVVETDFGGISDTFNSISMDNLCKYMFVLHTEGRSWSGRLKYLLNCDSIPIIHKLDWTAEYYSLLKPNGPEQNYVQVERDWSDLEEKVKYYLEHPDEAQRIADNAKATFRLWYNSPAATACYWRRLIRGYRSVAYEPELYENVTVKISGQDEDQRHLRGWSLERFLYSDESKGIGWNFQDDHD